MGELGLMLLLDGNLKYALLIVVIIDTYLLMQRADWSDKSGAIIARIPSTSARHESTFGYTGTKAMWQLCCIISFYVQLPQSAPPT